MAAADERGGGGKIWEDSWVKLSRLANLDQVATSATSSLGFLFEGLQTSYLDSVDVVCNMNLSSESNVSR